MNGSFWKKKKAGSVFLAVLLLTTLLAGCGINEGKAEKYVQANLDLTFQGQTQEAKEILGASDSDLKKVYENGINAFVQDCLLNVARKARDVARKSTLETNMALPGSDGSAVSCSFLPLYRYLFFQVRNRP